MAVSGNIRHFPVVGDDAHLSKAFLASRFDDEDRAMNKNARVRFVVPATASPASFAAAADSALAGVGKEVLATGSFNGMDKMVVVRARSALEVDGCIRARTEQLNVLSRAKRSNRLVGPNRIDLVKIVIVPVSNVDNALQSRSRVTLSCSRIEPRSTCAWRRADLSRHTCMPPASDVVSIVCEALHRGGRGHGRVG
jgi:hypothetical protein